MNTSSALKIIGVFLGWALLVAAAEAHAYGLTLNPPPKPAIGQQDTATADLLVSHPNTTPCIVPLFQSDVFDDFSPRPVSYTPPAACPPPWAKVVFVGNFRETTGVQFDRTAYLFLGNANIYFGTTPEPSSTLGPTWNVQRDLTVYSALFTQAQTGEMTLGNLVNSTYTGVIYGSGYLYFYPFPQSRSRHRPLPSAILPLNANNHPAFLYQTTNALSQQFSFPTNMTRIYLDIIAQSQSNDEFWYTCVPDQYESELQSCGSTGYRQVIVQVDGQTVAYAPVSPWIYTGGIDPFLWAPTPGAQTLNFKPYRVNLTALAAELDNGQPHTVSVSVDNADSYFSVAANLLIFQDPNLGQITGKVTSVRVPALAPQINNQLKVDNAGNVSGSLAITSQAHGHLAGYINLPRGRVTTVTDQQLSFSNSQAFTINSTVYDQDIILNSVASSHSVTTLPDGRTRVTVSGWQFPLRLNYDQVQQSNGDFAITTTVSQQYGLNTLHAGPRVFRTAEQNTVNSQDTLDFDPSFNFLGHSDMTSSQQFQFKLGGSSFGPPLCYRRTIANQNNAVTSVTDSPHCHLFWP